MKFKNGVDILCFVVNNRFMTKTDSLVILKFVYIRMYFDSKIRKRGVFYGTILKIAVQYTI